MTAALEPYSAMKDSGVPWLGQVPGHWEVLPNRALFVEVKERDHPEEQMLSVTITKGIIRQRALLADTSKKDSSKQEKSAYKLVRPGDIAYNKMRAWQGAVGVSDYQGIVSPAYVVQRPRACANPRYFHHLLRTPAFAKEAERWSYGITSDMWSLRPEHFKMIYGCLPPLPEQAAIVRFLDHADRRIRRYIRAKQKLIKLLEEQKQAIIHRAVTRGLDPNVRLKPSGVEWLGDVPKHWEVRAFTRCALERADYRGATPTKIEAGVFLVTAKNIRKGWIDYDASREFVSPDEYSTIMRRGLPRCGDLLLTTEAPLGNAALVDREDVALAQRVIRFRVDPRRLVPLFALHSVLSPYFQNQLLCRGTGSTALGIKASKLPQLQMLCPPLPEQQQILEAVTVECSPLERARTRTLGEIDLLREFRTRLVADVVTGKVDVREVAARLPSEPAEPASIDDATATGEDDDEIIDDACEADVGEHES